MNSARPLPNSRNLKPPPLPKGLAIVPPPARVEDIEDDLEVTAVANTPPEIIEASRSDVRELRVSRPPPPRPSSLPRAQEALAKKSGPPPLPVAVPPVVAEVRPPPMPAAPSTPAPVPVSTQPPAARPLAVSELEMSAAIQPRAVILARTAWFFGVFVTTGAFRWAVERLSQSRAWLATEWRHAGIRARAPRER